MSEQPEEDFGIEREVLGVWYVVVSQERDVVYRLWQMANATEGLEYLVTQGGGLLNDRLMGVYSTRDQALRAIGYPGPITD